MITDEGNGPTVRRNVDLLTEGPAIKAIGANLSAAPGVDVRDAAGWFVANPQVTVVDVRRLQRMEKAVNEMMDEVAGTDLDNSGPKALKAFLDKMSQPEGVDY